MTSRWPYSLQVPLSFGPELACGASGDQLTGEVVQPVYSSAYFNFRFSITEAEEAIQVALYAVQQSSPTATLNVSLYNDNDGAIGSTLLASGSYSPSQVPSRSPGWTAFITLAVSLTAGYYWLQITSPDSTSTSNYWVFMNLAGPSWFDIGSTAVYSGIGSIGGNSGWSVLWVEDTSGNNLELLPFGTAQNWSYTQLFTAQSSFQVNSIVLWTNDMEFNLNTTYEAVFTIADETTGQTLATATANQYYNSHGLVGSLPYQLSHPVMIVEGHTYSISMSDPESFYSDERASSMDPASAGPTEQSAYWWGGLGFADFSVYRIGDYINSHILGSSAGDTIGSNGGTGQVGVRFVPNNEETLETISLRTYDGAGTRGNYGAGTSVTVSLFAACDEPCNSPIGSQPSGTALQSVTVDSGTIPHNGFFTASGFSHPLSAGKSYWIVWSAPSATVSGGYVPQRNVSPFRQLMLTSNDGGSSWSYPAQGPTDLSWYATTSKETLGSPFNVVTTEPLNSTTQFAAAPFVFANNTTITCVIPQYSGISPGGIVEVTVYPDNGAGTAPNMMAPLGSGIINSDYFYTYSGGVSGVVPLSNPVYCAANTKMWLVFSMQTGTGDMLIGTYWTAPVDPPVPSGYEVLVTSNGGSTWSAITTDQFGVSIAAATCYFMIGAEVGGSSLVINALKAQGVTVKGALAYGQPLEPSYSPFSSLAAAVEFYNSVGFVEYPFEDGSNGMSSISGTMKPEYNAWAAVDGAITAPMYGWGYYTQGYSLTTSGLPLATEYPDDAEFYLVGGNLVAAAVGGSVGQATSTEAVTTSMNTITISIADAYDNYPVGIQVQIDVGANAEALTVESAGQTNGTITFTSNFTKSHSSGVVVYAIWGIVIDAPDLVTAWENFYSIINTDIGLRNLFAVSAWPDEDHPVNYGGAQDNNGGHNMNTYWRYVNSGLGLYLQDVGTPGTGLHNSDSSECLLWPLHGVANPSFSGLTQVSQSGTWPDITYSGGVIPTSALADDVSTYHHAGHATTTTFSEYCAAMNAELELALLQNLQSYTSGQAFSRTAMSSSVLSLVPSYQNALLEVTVGGGNISLPSGLQASGNLGDAFAGMQANGGRGMSMPYWNFADPDDNDSNILGTTSQTSNSGQNVLYVGETTAYFDVGEQICISAGNSDQEGNAGDAQAPIYIMSIQPGTSLTLASNSSLTSPYNLRYSHPQSEDVYHYGEGPGYANASSYAVNTFFLDVLPYLSHYPFFEADTEPAQVQARSTATRFGHFGGIWKKTQIDGWFGYVQDQIKLLVVDSNPGDAWRLSGFSLVAHQWGTSTLSGWNLSQFDVVYGWPSSSEDQSALEAAVSNGATLILLTSMGAPSSVTGIGGAAETVYYNGSQSTYPFLSPYASTDLYNAFYDASSNPEAIVGYVNNYGSGKVVTLVSSYSGDGFAKDALTSGLGYLTLNAVVWLGGLTPPGIYLPQYVLRTSWNTGGYSGIGVFMLGFLNGEKTIFLSNATTSQVDIKVNFSGSFYGYPSPWKVTDLNTAAIVQGTGDVELDLELPPSDWMVLTTQESAPTSTAGRQVIIVE